MARVIREGAWLDADGLVAAPDIAALTTQVILDENRLRHCVLCRAEQPDDVRWSRYAMEVKRLADGQSEDVAYACCPSCEPRLDAMLFNSGAAGADEDR